MASHAWAEHDLVAYFVRRTHYRVVPNIPTVTIVPEIPGQLSGLKTSKKICRRTPCLRAVVPANQGQLPLHQISPFLIRYNHHDPPNPTLEEPSWIRPLFRNG